MALTKYTINKTLESTLPSTATDCNIYFTDKQNLYITNNLGNVTKVTDIISCGTLPSSGQLQGKLYMLLDGTIKMWDGTAWKSFGATIYTLPVATSSTLGGVLAGGNGVNIDGTGLVSAKLGTGLAFDVSKNIVPDTANIDITQLKNYSMLNLGSPKGFFDSSATLATFADAQKGSFWIYSGTTSSTIGGVSFSTNDQLWCKTSTVGSPSDLSTNFVKVPYTLIQATTTSAGAVKLGSATPLMNSSTASVGTSTAMSREDHVHPSDTSKISTISSSTTNGIVIWNDATGKVLKDSTKTLPLGAIVGVSDGQSLTNKMLIDSSNYISNLSDTTKQLQFDISGNATTVTGKLKTNFSTAKTINFPDKTGTLQIAPNVVILSTNGNQTLVENTIYEVNNLAVVGSVLTLPTTASVTGAYIQILVTVLGFDDSHTFLISGTINGGTNSIINNRSFVEYKFYYSASTSNWILASTNSGY